MLDKVASFFKFKENKTNFRTEILAGLTTFIGMAYILAVNPAILSETGMDSGAVFTATALSAFIGTLIMALLANYPFALAPGMGVNAYFAYTVVLQMGYSWQQALGAVFIEGIIFILLTLTNIREKLFDMIPGNLRLSITVGIGLYITMIGFKNANILVDNESTLVAFYSWSSETLFTRGLTVLLAIIGIFITIYLYLKGYKISILAGILITWILGIVCQLVGLYIPNPAEGFTSLLPNFSGGFRLYSLTPTFLKFDLNNILSFDFLIVIMAFLFVDFFDTIGTLMGCSINAGYINKNNSLPKLKQALFSDAVATTVGACLGTSAVTTFVESELGIAEGGRTGFTSVITAILFLLSLFLSPIFLAIPVWATTPALVLVGFLMIRSITQIDFTDPLEGIPSFLCLIGMPLFYSIAEGIGLGIISYSVLHLITGRYKKVNYLMYFVAILYLFKYIFI